MTDTPVVATRAEVLGFLRGRNALAGRWFGDKVPGMPQYWWRSYLHILDEPVHTGMPTTNDPPKTELEVGGEQGGTAVAYIRDCAEPDAPPKAVFYEAPSMGELERRRSEREGKLGVVGLAVWERAARDCNAHDDEFPCGPA